jgi:hypothetical protein
LCGTFYAHFTRFDFHFPPCLSVYFSVYFSVLAEKNIHSKHISSVSTQKKWFSAIFPRVFSRSSNFRRDFAFQKMKIYRLKSLFSLWFARPPSIG